jgi:hypothetical protein
VVADVKAGQVIARLAQTDVLGFAISIKNVVIHQARVAVSSKTHLEPAQIVPAHQSKSLKYVYKTVLIFSSSCA